MISDKAKGLNAEYSPTGDVDLSCHRLSLLSPLLKLLVLLICWNADIVGASKATRHNRVNEGLCSLYKWHWESALYIATFKCKESVLVPVPSPCLLPASACEMTLDSLATSPAGYNLLFVQREDPKATDDNQ